MQKMSSSIMQKKSTVSMSNSLREKYEGLFSESVNAVGARAFALGRQAMVILLKALDVKKGDKVGVCSYTCYSVAEAVKVCGALPVYLDVDEYLCIEPQEILRKGKDLKVVILQHTFGIPGQLDELLAICEKMGVRVIEDCAHSLGCSWKGKPLGQFGEGAIYSSEWGKPYTTGQGGMLTVNSRQMLNRIDELIKEVALPPSMKSELILEFERRVYPILGNSQFKKYVVYACNKLRNINFVRSSSQPQTEFCFYPGYIRLMGELTAKAGLKQIKNWPKLMQLRRDNTKMIEQYLSKAGLALWPKPKEVDATLLRYPVTTSDKPKILKESRRKLDIAAWYESPVHPLKGSDLSKVNYHAGSCQKVEDMIGQLAYLPTGLTLNKRSLEAMLRIILQ